MKISFIIVLLSFFTMTTVAQAPAKKNSRPDAPKEETASKEAVKREPASFFYRFEKPNFYLSDIVITHDQDGVGTIAFTNDDLESTIKRELVLSEGTLETLESIWEELEFLDSTDEYQYKRDYSHLGKTTLKMSKSDRDRSVEFNFTTHPEMAKLVNEYRKIRYEHIWRFDIGIAIKNRPLDSPRVMGELERYIDRNEISDPPHMIPFLTELSKETRMPLIARNTAKRIIEKIKK